MIEKIISNTLIEMLDSAEEFLENNDLDKAYELLYDSHKLSLFRKYDKIESRLNDLIINYLLKTRI